MGDNDEEEDKVGDDDKEEMPGQAMTTRSMAQGRLG